jgi:hypothetical protein
MVSRNGVKGPCPVRAKSLPRRAGRTVVKCAKGAMPNGAFSLRRKSPILEGGRRFRGQPQEREIVRHVSTLMAAAGILGALTIPADARTDAVGHLNGKWEIWIRALAHAPDGSKPEKSLYTAIAKLTDCTNASSSALCIEFKDSNGDDVSLSGSRFGNGFFVKSSDGNLVLSGQSVNPGKFGFASKFRGVGSRMNAESIDSLMIFGKRLFD